MSPKTILPVDTVPSFRYEEEASRLGATRIAGIDEAGRGPLAGPVVAAAVILPRNAVIPDINDSKLLAAAVRERLYRDITSLAVDIGVGVVHSDVIDRINIYQATLEAMRQAVLNLSTPPDYLLVDGPMKPLRDIPLNAIVKGDRLSVSIAAAAIVAKVTRDSMMLEYHRLYPHYRFDLHKGYATKAHKAALCAHGPCRIHRMCFKGVKAPEDAAPTVVSESQEEA